ncbi:hypothetical protein D3C78_1807500 [compost metagenome]
MPYCALLAPAESEPEPASVDVTAQQPESDVARCRSAAEPERTSLPVVEQLPATWTGHLQSAAETALASIGERAAKDASPIHLP